MRLNALEKLIVNSPSRAVFQQYMTGRRLLKMGGPATCGTVLEIGCGRGVGAEMILSLFGAEAVHGFDLDARQVLLAKGRITRRNPPISLWVGTATAIPAPDAAYDHVFDFGIIHHVHDWRAAVREAYRVLKPGGRFYVEEFLRDFITHPVWRRLLVHPQEDRFDGPDFARALRRTGFRVIASDEKLKTVAWFVAEK